MALKILRSNITLMVKKTLRAARAPVTKSYAENDSFIDEIIDGCTNPH
jgi:hypothetical protein